MKNNTTQPGDLVRCKLQATCTVPCDSKKPHDAATCVCKCHLNDHAKCIEYIKPAPQGYILSEAEETMQVPGAAAAR